MKRFQAEEAVPGPSVFPSGEPGVSGDFWSSQRPLVLWSSIVVLPEVAGGILGLGLLQESETLRHRVTDPPVT